MTEAEQVMKRCQIGTRNYEEANNLHAECYRVIGKLLAEKSMRETQRLGQEIEQEDDGITLTTIRHPRGKPAPDDLNAESLEVVELELPEQEPVAYLCENAVGHRYFRWKKPSSTYKPIPLYTSPPQRTERPVDCERCNRLEEQAYDLVGELRVANIKLSMRPPRTWVGLTDEERKDIELGIEVFDMSVEDVLKEAEAKLKEKNT